MFGMLTDAIDNGLGLLDDIISGETPRRRDVARLISDGMTITAVAASFGVAESIIEDLLGD